MHLSVSAPESRLLFIQLSPFHTHCNKNKHHWLFVGQAKKGARFSGSVMFFTFTSEVSVRKHRNWISSRRLRCWRRTEWILTRARWSSHQCGVSGQYEGPCKIVLGDKCVFMRSRMYLATQLFWLLLLSDSLCCKETEGSISSNGEYRWPVNPGLEGVVTLSVKGYICSWHYYSWLVLNLNTISILCLDFENNKVLPIFIHPFFFLSLVSIFCLSVSNSGTRWPNSSLKPKHSIYMQIRRRYEYICIIKMPSFLCASAQEVEIPVLSCVSEAMGSFTAVKVRDLWWWRRR